jgi:hypothetical protein
MSTGIELIVKSKLPIRLTLRQATGRGAFENLDSFQVACRQFLLIYPREEQGVVVDDRVSDQPAAFVPDLLLRFGLHAKFTGVDVRDRASHPVAGLAAVECLLRALPQGGIVDEVEDIDASADVVQLPERLLGLVLTGIGTQFAHDRRLGHILLRK